MVEKEVIAAVARCGGGGYVLAITLEAIMKVSDVALMTIAAMEATMEAAAEAMKIMAQVRKKSSKGPFTSSSSSNFSLPLFYLNFR